MLVEFRASFGKDIDKVKDKTAKLACLDVIEKIKNVDSLNDIPHIKKIQGAKGVYRIRVGEYRIGIEYSNATVIFKRFLQRKDIYKYFP